MLRTKSYKPSAITKAQDHKPDDTAPHYLKAAIAGTIAIGAYEMSKKDEGHDGSKSAPPKPDKAHGPNHVNLKPHHKGRSTDMIAEALGTYALGRQMMGHTDLLSPTLKPHCGLRLLHHSCLTPSQVAMQIRMRCCLHRGL